MHSEGGGYMRSVLLKRPWEERQVDTRGIPFFSFAAEIPGETSVFPFHLFHLQSLFLCHFPKLLPRTLHLFSSFFKGDRSLPGPPPRTRVTWNSRRPTVGRGVHRWPVTFTGGEGVVARSLGTFTALDSSCLSLCGRRHWIECILSWRLKVLKEV